MLLVCASPFHTLEGPHLPSAVPLQARHQRRRVGCPRSRPRYPAANVLLRLTGQQVNDEGLNPFRIAQTLRDVICWSISTTIPRPVPRVAVRMQIGYVSTIRTPHLGMCADSCRLRDASSAPLRTLLVEDWPNRGTSSLLNAPPFGLRRAPLRPEPERNTNG